MLVIVKIKYMYIIFFLYKIIYNKVKYVFNLYLYNLYDNLLYVVLYKRVIMYMYFVFIIIDMISFILD